METEIQILSRNLVCLLEKLNKKKVDIEKLLTLIQIETPAIINPEEEVPILIINFKRAGFQITAIQNSLQIISTAPPNAKATKNFTELTKKVLEAFSEHWITAYGFNFSYSIKSNMDVTKYFNIQFNIPKTEEWIIIPNNSIKLVFEKANKKFTLSVADEPEKILRIDVNVHHEESLATSSLLENIESLYDEANKDSLVLVKAVLGKDDE